MKTFQTFLLFFCLACCEVFNFALAETGPSVTVKSYARHIGNSIVYTYLVTNHGPNRLFRFTIGCNCTDAEDINDEPQLVIYPVDYDFKSERISKGSYSAPAGWKGLVAQYEGTSLIGFAFSVTRDIGVPLLPGYTETFSITTPTIDDRDRFALYDEHPMGIPYFYEKNRQGYLTGHYSYREDIPNGGNRVVSYPMQLIDQSAPSISLTLNPDTLWPPNNKAAQIIATISVSDDYDPEPEIKLESITANETLADGDIQDAQLATDDRSFSLTAKRAGDNMAGRIYTITYSATDASGNKASATATVTVPHDQREK